VRPLEVHFTRPPEFDAVRHLTLSLATLPRAFATEVLLDTNLETARRTVFPAFGVLERTSEGVLLRGQTDDLHWFARELARLPFAFEVRHPTALREALEAHAKRLLERAKA
jgi:predicted DNA-binding transcriptional regulator YafY